MRVLPDADAAECDERMIATPEQILSACCRQPASAVASICYRSVTMNRVFYTVVLAFGAATLVAVQTGRRHPSPRRIPRTSVGKRK